jgi:hypothetical protein
VAEKEHEMPKFAKFAVLAGVVLIASSISIDAVSSGASASAASPAARPRFAVLHTARKGVTPKTSLPTWQFSYSYQAQTYTDTFVGTNPSTGTSTTIPTYVIPIKLTLGSFVANPLQILSNGKTVVKNTTSSPIFKSKTDYVQGGTDLGTTQYIDAFQRGSLWGTVSTHTGYHVLLGKPTVEPVKSYTVPASQGVVGSPFGTRVLEVNLPWFDAKAESLLTSLHIPANSLPIFLVTQTYLTEGGCCIGGYHNYNGVQAYSVFSYIQTVGTFSQDVSALSHEIGEYIDDPFTNNTDVPAACGAGAAYEVGDPLEGDANYGTYPYALGGFTYHLQDLVTPVYFGAPASTSVHGWDTLQGTPLSVCQNGG